MTMLNQGGNYLKVENVVSGDKLRFKDGGSWVESTKYKYPDGNFKKDFIMTVEYKDAEYLLRLGKYCREDLIKVYGKDTSSWVGKEATIAIENYRSLNKKGIVLVPISDGTTSDSSDDGIY